MSKYLSHKLASLSFVLIIMVVFLHSTNLIVKVDGDVIKLNRGYSFFIQTFFGSVAKVAVPLFFGISGYLFFLNLNGTISDFITKWRKRFRSLVIPYLFWSLWGLLVYLILQTLPLSNSFFTKKLIIEYSFSELLNTILIDPISYQLWFVKDLIILVLLSPVLYYLLEYLKIIGIIIVFAAWLNNINFLIIPSEPLLFFMLGAFIAKSQNKILSLVLTEKALFYFCIWLSIVLLKTILITLGHQKDFLFILVHKLSILSGILGLWSIYDYFSAKTDFGEKTKWLYSFTFFIYAFHEPTLTIVKKLLFYILGKSEIVSVSIYILSPIIIISLSIYIGYLLKTCFPKFFSVIIGGR